MAPAGAVGDIEAVTGEGGAATGTRDVEGEDVGMATKGAAAVGIVCSTAGFEVVAAEEAVVVAGLEVIVTEGVVVEVKSRRKSSSEEE